MRRLNPSKDGTGGFWRSRRQDKEAINAAGTTSMVSPEAISCSGRWLLVFGQGEIARVVVPTGKKDGTYLDRVVIRVSGSFNIQTATGLIQGIHHRFSTLIQRMEEYGYSWTKIALEKGEGEAGTGAAHAAALSPHGLNTWVSCAIG